MPKPNFKRMKTIRKKVQAPSKHHTKNRHEDSRKPREFHLDGSPCSFYCSCMQKEGFGITSCVYDKKDNLFGDYSELIATVQILVNSKCFMEFLCTCRYYIYEYNLTKKLYYIMVLCSTLRDIAMTSIHMQSSYDITRFLHYCHKWIKEFKQDTITIDSFLTNYMREINSEIHVLNSFLFKQWCSEAILHDSTFKPLVNPFQQIITKQVESHISTKAQYYLYLPIMINTQRIDFDRNGRLITISQNPSLSITSSIIHQANNIIRWNQCIFLKCADSSLSFQIPPNISLPFKDENSIAIYSIRSLIVKDNHNLIVFKRIFPSIYHFTKKKKIYDVHANGRWIRIENQNVSEVSWKEVESCKPYWIQYERVYHSSS